LKNKQEYMYCYSKINNRLNQHCFEMVGFTKKNKTNGTDIKSTKGHVKVQLIFKYIVYIKQI